MSDLVLEFCNFILSLYQSVTEALTTLHGALILLLLLVEVLPHAIAHILGLSTVVCDLLLKLSHETVFLVLMSLLN